MSYIAAHSLVYLTFFFFLFVRLPVRIKLLFIAAVNHVYYCNSWRPTRPQEGGFTVTDAVHMEKTFIKGQLCFTAEFTI